MLKDNLRIYRDKAGMTAKAVAERVGIAHTTYRNYENTSRQPDVATLKKIADVLGVTVDLLLEDNRDESPQEMIYDVTKVKPESISTKLMSSVGKVLLETEKGMLIYLYERASLIDKNRIWKILNNYNPQTAIQFCMEICEKKGKELGQGTDTKKELDEWMQKAEANRDKVIRLEMDMDEFRKWSGYDEK